MRGIKIQFHLNAFLAQLCPFSLYEYYQVLLSEWKGELSYKLQYTI